MGLRFQGLGFFWVMFGVFWYFRVFRLQGLGFRVQVERGFRQAMEAYPSCKAPCRLAAETL